MLMTRAITKNKDKFVVYRCRVSLNLVYKMKKLQHLTLRNLWKIVKTPETLRNPVMIIYLG